MNEPVRDAKESGVDPQTGKMAVISRAELARWHYWKGANTSTRGTPGSATDFVLAPVLDIDLASPQIRGVGYRDLVKCRAPKSHL